MVSKIAVFGSCASRDVFNSEINPNYKDYFKIVTAAERISMISLMAKPIQIDNPDLIKSYENGQLRYFGSKCIEMDFSKTFLLDLKNNTINYLILDNLFESRFGIINFEDKIITNNFWDLYDTQFYKSLENFKVLSMATNPKEYLKLYKKNFNLFYEYINNECGDIKLILNKACDTDKYLDNDGSIKIRETEYCNEHNQYTYKFNRFIEDNFDVDTIELNIMNYPNDVNHKWGPGTSHYVPEYYKDFTKKLNKIIQNNKQQEKIFAELLNKNEEIFNMQMNNASKDSILKRNLRHYFSSRIDIKNWGDYNNKVEFLSISDNDATLAFPNWFKDNDGEGAVVESTKGRIDLKVKCIGNGALNIRLRGVNAKYKNKHKPVFIKFTSLECNGEQILNEEKLVSHDDFYQSDINVSDGDIMFITVEWSPFKVNSF